MHKSNTLLNIAGLIVIFAAMNHGSELVNQILIAIVIAIVLRPVINTLKRWHFPFYLALLIILGGFIIVVTLLGFIIGNTVSQFQNNLTFITQQAIEKINYVYNLIQPLLHKLGINLNAQISSYTQVFNSYILNFISQIFFSLKNILSSTMIIVLTALFILIDIDTLNRKLHLSQSHNPQNIEDIQKIFTSSAKYIEKKFIVSLGTAVVVYFICLLFNVQFGLMWAVLTLFFNFIPNIGVFIVSIPMILQVMILHNVYVATSFSIILIVVHFLSGNVIEPKVMSKYLNISTLTVWLSLLFWNYILGPIGMLLSVPLTLTLKIILEMTDQYQKIATILEGDEASTKPKPKLK